MPPRKAKAAKKRETKPKTETVKKMINVTHESRVGSIKTSVVINATDESGVGSFTTSVVINAITSVVNDDIITQTEDDNRKQEESGSHKDDGKISSGVMTPRKTCREIPPVVHHIITPPPPPPPPVVKPRRYPYIKRDQKTMGSIQENVGGINTSECPYEALDSPAAKQPRGKQMTRGEVERVSRRKGSRQKAVSGQRGVIEISDGNSPTKDLKSKSEELKIESPPSEERRQHNAKISDFYPVRRSSRRTEAEIKKEIDQNYQECIKLNRQDGLKVENLGQKGRGVITTRTFTRNEFVVEYAGDLIDDATAKRKESEYLAKQKGCYMYYFNHKSKSHCIDATSESGHFGRLVNHSRVNPNCHTKIVEVKGQPHLILIASRKIEEGEELLYDYGDRSKEALDAHPWLAL